MESTITGTVGEVTGRTVNTSRGQAPIYDVTIGDTKTSTFKAHVAEEAKALQGSEVTAKVDVTERNGYTNHTLLGVTLVSAAPQNPYGNTASGKSVVYTTASGIPLAPATSPESRGGMSPEREQKIVRQSSMATAFNYAASAGLSEDEAFALAGRIYARAMGVSGSTSHDAEELRSSREQPAQEPVAAVATAPTEVVDDIKW